MISQLQEAEQEKHDQKSTAATQARLIRDLEKTTREEEANIEMMQAKIRKEIKRQRNAVLDLIPLRGLIVAIKSGKRKRAIPVYSQIDGIVSAIKGHMGATRARVESASQSFNDCALESSRTREAQDETLQRVARLVAKTTTYRNCIYACNRDSKAMGKRLTAIQADRMHPKQLLSQLDAVEDDLDLVSKPGDATFKSQIIQHLRELVSTQRPETPTFKPHTLERKNGFRDTIPDDHASFKK